MKLLPALAATVFLLLYPSISSASTTAEVRVKCPIGGKTFKTVEAMSGTQFGTNLDQKPFGAILAPWPIAKCPDNGFVVYKKDFTKDELDRLQAYVMSDEYQALQKIESNYYLAATLLTRMDTPAEQIAYAFLQSTWEVEADSRYRRYAEKTLAHFESVIAKPPAAFDKADIAFYKQIAGEMERRLGRFDAAKKRFDALIGAPDVKGTTLEQVVAQEIELVKSGDSATHPFTYKKP